MDENVRKFLHMYLQGAAMFDLDPLMTNKKKLKQDFLLNFDLSWIDNHTAIFGIKVIDFPIKD